MNLFQVNNEDIITTSFDITLISLSLTLRTFNALIYQAGTYLFQVNNGNSRTICEICSKLTIRLRILSECGRMRTRISQNTDTF